ncbi:MAG: hypothetical protein WDW36_007626 [Sanguina aurantia]
MDNRTFLPDQAYTVTPPVIRRRPHLHADMLHVPFMCCSELEELSQTLNQMDVNNSAPSLPPHSHSIVIENRSSNTGPSNRQLQQAQQRLRGSTTRGPTSLQHSTHSANFESRDCTYSPAVVQQRNTFMAGVLGCPTGQQHTPAAGTEDGSHAQRHHSNHISSCGSATDLVEFLHSDTQPAPLRRRSLLFASDSNGGGEPRQPATTVTNRTCHMSGLDQGASGTSHSSNQNNSYTSSSSAVFSSFQHAVSSREHTFFGNDSESHAPSIPNAPANHPAWFSGCVTSTHTSLPSFPSHTRSCGPDGGQSSAGHVVLAAVQGWWNMCVLLATVAVIELLSLFHQHQCKQQFVQAERERHSESPQEPPPPPSQPVFDKGLTGGWVKDGPPADMEEAFKVMHLNGLIKMAVKLVRGLELEIGEDYFDMAVCSVVSWFKVRERYALNGESSMHMRRDLRKGKHSGRVSPLPGGGLLLQLTWAGNCGGTGEDRFQLVGPQLQVHSKLVVNGMTATYMQAYRRRE